MEKSEMKILKLVAKHDIHPNLIQQWKWHARESMPDLFSGNAAAQQNYRETEIKA